MLPSQHAFSHQHYPPDWASHPSHTPHHVSHTPSIAGNGNQFPQFRGPAGLDHAANIERSAQPSAMSGAGMGGNAAATQEGVGMNEENRRVLEWIAQMMRPETRESALLELSKKREQVPELALILWHSFGTNRTCNSEQILSGIYALTHSRSYDLVATGDHFRIPPAEPQPAHSRRIKQGMQRPRTPPMRCQPQRNTRSLLRRQVSLFHRSIPTKSL